jgi:transcriptional regulator with GAF, ATPase, and Fis domain
MTTVRHRVFTDLTISRPQHGRHAGSSQPGCTAELGVQRRKQALMGTPLNNHESLDPDRALRELAGIVLGDSSFDAILDRAVVIAKRSIDGADSVSVTVQRTDGPTTMASTGELAAMLDERQYELGHGPCLEAAADGHPVVVSDFSTEQRWPGYAPQVVAAGVRSSLSVPLTVDGQSIGAFNAYARAARTFDDDRLRQAAQEIAAYAGIVLNNADRFFLAADRVDQMMAVVQSRAVIEQAKGILMASRRCSAEEAFEILVRISQHSHRKLRDVASALVVETPQA